MRKLLIVSTALLFLAGCTAKPGGGGGTTPPPQMATDGTTTKASSTAPDTAAESTPEPDPEPDPFESLLWQFFIDAGIPEAVRAQYAAAMRGDKEAQNGVFQYAYGGELTWPVAGAVYAYSLTKAEDECLYAIAMLYYQGGDNIGFVRDRAAAFEWVKLAAEKGNAEAAICAGDMVRLGDGVSVDGHAAFAFYNAAHDIAPDCFTMERLGDCYADGVGTTIDRRKAFGFYMDSALFGYSEAIRKLADFAEYAELSPITLYKAASSLNYTDGYFAMAYDGLDGYAADASKRDVVDRLLAVWDNGEDPAASDMQAALTSGEYFPAEFVEALTQAVYTYSYHAFAEQYGLRPNRTHEDTGDIYFKPEENDNWFYSYERDAIRYLEYTECQFYEYDFDGDGEDEIGIPIHSGAGGAFSTDGFGIFKKNADGLYELYATGSLGTFRDAMRIIRYGGRIYFIANWFDDTGNEPHNVIAKTVGIDGQGHMLSITCKDYGLQHVLTYTAEPYADGYGDLFEKAERQMRGAVAAAKQQRVYSPDGEKQFTYESAEDWWWEFSAGFVYEMAREDVFFTADIANDGVGRVVHKSRFISFLKYYDDHNWFQIYEGDGLVTGAEPLAKPEYGDNFHGLHSGGNLYKLLPVARNAVAFWTIEHGGVTYCATLQKIELTYALQLFRIQNGEVETVRRSLYFETAQSMEIKMS